MLGNVASSYGDDTNGVMLSIPETKWDIDEADTKLREHLEDVVLLTLLSPLPTTSIVVGGFDASELDPDSDSESMPRQEALLSLLGHARTNLGERANTEIQLPVWPTTSLPVDQTKD